MNKLESKKLSRISEYIKMLDSDTFDNASWVTDDENLYTNKDKERILHFLRNIVDSETYSNGRDKKLLLECETIYQQWINLKK